MAIQNKSFMNFLGGEVSPSAYKRLDMAGNAKWFETAKNIWFGTTGDFHNRRGFQYIDKPYSGALAGEKMKLIPFVYNRSESYCIALYNNDFSILKNGSFLKDSNNQRIFVNHFGLDLSQVEDISYCQIGDIVYVCAKGSSNIFTITRKSDQEWEWGTFDYNIPPMRENNSDNNKKMLFESNSQYTNRYVCDVDLSSVFVPFGDVLVQFVSYKNGNYYYYNLLNETSGPFVSRSAFVDYFNNNNLRTDIVTSCEENGHSIRFYFPVSTQTTYDQFFVTIRIGTGNGTKYVFSGDNPFPEQNQYGESYSYQLRENAIVTHATVCYKVINTGIVEREYDFIPSKNLSEFVSYVQSETLTTGQNRWTYASYSSPDTIVCRCIHTINHGVYGWESVYFKNIDYVVPLNTQKTYRSDWAYPLAESNNNIYNINCSFDFFSTHNVGDVFSVESIYSPNREGKQNENKSYYQDSGSFPATTDPFWSNGNWRFVTSGLFAGTIELQYSYDGTEWFTHRTWSSSIRGEGDSDPNKQVYYGNTFNEYGTIDVDDNVLIRLKFQFTSIRNLSVLLDAESFKNRSYFKILQKNTNTSGIVECILYNVGTPGITKYNSSTGSYDVNHIYEWAESAWSLTNGFPKIAFFYQNRLAFACTEKDKQTLWFSKTNDFKDFSTKIEYTDDDPITITALIPTGISEITGIASSKKLFVFTADHEEGIQDEGALTQSNKQLLNFTYYGSEPIETRNVSNKIIFVERGGHAVRALTYDYAQENYEALDLTIPYKHLLQNEKIVASEYIPGDYKTYLMLTSIGRLICFKYIPEQKIEACSWFMHAAGRITNVCVVNNVDSYDLYVAVDSGSNKQIEYMKITPYDTNNYLDSYRTFNFENATSSITDTDYFVPGKKYTVFIADKTYKLTADNTCTITLPESTTNCAVGLSYVSEATILPPNLLFQNGTTNYNRKNLFKAHFTYMNSDLFKVGIKGRDGSFKQVYAIEETTFDNPDQNGLNERHFSIQSSYFDQNMLSFIQEEPSPMNITNAEMEIDYGGK